MMRMSLIQFDRQARRRAVICAAAAASIASCAADGGVRDGATQGEETPAAAALQAPGAVRITQVTATGSGCPSGSWESSVSDDGTRVTVKFQRFIADLSRVTRVTKNCTVSITLNGGESYQYTPATVHLVGKSDSLAQYSADLRWSGTDITKAVSTSAAGSFARSFFVNDFWSPCGAKQKLYVNSQIRAEGRSNSDFQLTEEYVTFRSRRCAGADPVEPVEPPDDSEQKPDADKPVETAAVSISGANPTGSGCPSGTTKVVVAPDGSAVSISFDNLNSARSPSCSVSIQVAAPEGKSFALAGFTAHGQATLGEEVTARLLTNTAYTGAGVDLTREKVSEVVGPISGSFKLEETFNEDQLNFSSCGGATPSLRLIVRPTIANGGQGSFTVTSIDSLKFVTRSCE